MLKFMGTNKQQIKKTFYFFIQSLFVFQILVFIVEFFYPHLPNLKYSVSKEVGEKILFESALFSQDMQYLFYCYSVFFIFLSLFLFFIKKNKKYYLEIILLFLSVFSFLFAYQSTRGHYWYFGPSSRFNNTDSTVIIVFHLLLIFIFYKFRKFFLNIKK